MFELEPVSAARAVADLVHEGGHFVRVEETGLRGQVTLRVDLALPTVPAALADAVGLEVPAMRKVMVKDTRVAVWMAPDELLLVMPHGEVQGAVEALGKAFAGVHHLALDVSDQRVIFRLTGERVAELLAKGAPVDLSERAFPVGAMRRTHIAEIPVGFWRRESTEWEIVCFRSMAPHLGEWLRQCSTAGSEVY